MNAKCSECPRLRESSRPVCDRCHIARLESLCRAMADLIKTACPNASAWMDEDGLGAEYDYVMWNVR